MAKKDTPTTGRSDPKIERALQWVETYLASVQRLKGRAKQEETEHCFLAWGLDRNITAAAKAVASSLKSVGYPGEAARVRSLHTDLARLVDDMLVRSTPADPAHVPVSEYGMAYLVGAGTLCAAGLERALLDVRAVVCRDAQKPPNDAMKRRGRMPKAESEARRADMLATVRQHASLKDDPGALANMVGVGESTVRRWLDEEQQRYLESRAARPEPDEE